MQTYGSSVVPMIEANYEMFTVVEKTIADFFISNEKEMDFSSGRMAKMLHVSEASLSRFAKKMGYSGYREFIYNYQPSIAERPVGGRHRMWRNRPSTSCIRMRNCCKKHTA